MTARRPLRYATSFYGIIDLLSIVPTYLSLVVTGSQSLLVIRALRLLRVFRILKLGHFVGAGQLLQCAAEGHDFDAVHCKYCGAGLYSDLERASGATETP